MIGSHLQLPSPLHILDLFYPFTVFIKRDDLIHPEISGNKYRKLKYQFAALHASEYEGIITKGGAFSNHIYATAAYCDLIGVQSIGIIRGEIDLQNPTLKFASSKGMKLVPCARSDFQNNESKTISNILREFPNFKFIPEGGDHPDAIPGIVDMMNELPFVPDYFILAVGTGITAAGVLKFIIDKKWKTKLLAVSSMKNENLQLKILQSANCHDTNQFIYLSDYHLGGYAKLTQTLFDFDYDFYQKTGIRLDPIYTCKMMMALHDLMTKNLFTKKDKLVVYHSGGLQGWDGIRYKGLNKAART